jgi:DNA-binding PadR family transcriptional regulator
MPTSERSRRGKRLRRRPAAGWGGGPLHGYGIVQQVSTLSGGRVTLLSGTLYTALDRLVAQGPAEHDRDAAVDGRLRRYHRLTGDGRTALEAESRRMRDLGTVAETRLRATRPRPA